MRKIARFILWFFSGLLGLLLLLFVVLYISTRGDYPVPSTVENDASLPFIKINDRLFHAESFGQDTSEVVIVIHGGPGNDYRYLLPLKPLSESYRIVFYDQRGTGLSQRVSADEQSLEVALQDLAAIIDYYSPARKVNIIGHSWGGMLASGYLAMHPERVNHIVLAEPGMLTTEKAKEYFDSFKLKMTWPAIRGIVRVIFESLHVDNDDGYARQDYIFGAIGHLNVPGNPLAGYYCNKDVQTAHVPYWRYCATAGKEIIEKAKDEDGNVIIDLVTGLENFPGKVLLIAGECNEIVGPEFQEGHLAFFRDIEMVVIEEAGHTMLGEKPEECLEIIRTYFGED